MTETLVPNAATLAQLERIWRTRDKVRLTVKAREAVDAAAAVVRDKALQSEAIYGINTGFGKLASIRIPHQELGRLQHNLILSHCCGVGEPLDLATTRLMMVLKLLSLGRGASGIQWHTMMLIEQMLANDILPYVPTQGSLGASGDLAPLAHMSAPLIGEGHVYMAGALMPAQEALQRSGLTAVTLGPKEGLALINGTQFSTACALTGLWEAWQNVCAGIVTGALSLDAIMGTTAPLTAGLHLLRGHAGQIAFSRCQRDLIAGSEIRESHSVNDSRVQDPYCIRCQPQVIGSVIDLLRVTARTLTIEANAVTDNPIILGDKIISGGNFHAEPVGFAADQIAIAVSEMGTISQRRIATIVDPVLSFGLPPFLAQNSGLNSGVMMAEVTSAALMSENKHLANPCSTDNTPTSANQEDHVSMAAHAARRLLRMNTNLRLILAIEAICAVEGIDYRAPLKTSLILQNVIARIRAHIPKINDDRPLSQDIQKTASLISSGALTQGIALPDLDEPAS